MAIGDAIKELRLERQMTQAEVCGDFITRNMLSKIENGSAKPSLPTIEHIARQLGVAPGYFFEHDASHASSETDALRTRLQTAVQNGDAAEVAAVFSLCAERVPLEDLLYASLLVTEDGIPRVITSAPRRTHLEGRRLLSSGKTNEAIATFKRVLDCDDAAVRHCVCADLERAYLSLGDYKNAYYYATNRMNPSAAPTQEGE